MLKKFSGWKPISKIIAIICIAAVISGTAYAASSAYTVISRTLNSDNISVSATVDTETVVQDDFLGVGSNLWTDPCSTGELRAMKMNDAYMQINYKRNMTSNPAYLRYSFLPQWLMFTDKEDKGQSDWENGNYNWESREFKAFFEYMKEFKKSGTEILLNYGGSISQEIQSWYAIKGVSASMGGSAPDNIEAFVKGFCAVLEKCESDPATSGVITYFSFYNEITGANFAVFGNKGVYVASMLTALDKELKARGLRDKIKIVGLDMTMQDKVHDSITSVNKLSESLWDALNSNADGVFDVLAHHYYYEDIEGSRLKGVKAVTELNKDFLTKAWNKDLMINEYTSSLGGVSGRYASSEAGLILNLVNNGVSAMASWWYYGAMAHSPVDVYMNDTGYNMWLSPATPTGNNYYQLPALEAAGVTRAIDGVANCFGERALFMNYIPNHTKVLKTTIDSEDMRVATFRKDDDMTVIIELNDAEKARDITINFNKNINKTFNKFTYTYPATADWEKCTLYEANAILPICEGQVTVANKLTDTAGEGHCLLVYTTLDEIEQLELNEVEVELKVGETYNFDITNIYGTDYVRNSETDTTVFDDKVNWSVVTAVDADNVSTNGGTVDSDGTYHADGVDVGDTIAIKADPNDGSGMYAIAIVKIVEASAS